MATYHYHANSPATPSLRKTFVLSVCFGLAWVTVLATLSFASALCAAKVLELMN